MAKVGVVIPVYNSSKYLLRCLDSVSRQTFSDFSVAVVNDGSTDNSQEILENYDASFPYYLIHQENQGVAEARKRGMEVLDCSYLAFIDSDDYIESDYLEKLVNRLEESHTNLCCARFAMHFNYPFIRKIGLKSKKVKVSRICLSEHREYLPFINVVCASKLFKRDYVHISDNGFLANEDLSINYLNFALADHVSFENSTAYHYLPNNDGLVSKELSGVGYSSIFHTIEPLVELRRHFEDYQLDQIYSKELESLFIKNLFQRIDSISRLVSDKGKQVELTGCLLSFLEGYYPDWRDNPYYKKRFCTFEIPDMVNCIRVDRFLDRIHVDSGPMEKDKVLEKYKKLSSD